MKKYLLILIMFSSLTYSQDSFFYPNKSQPLDLIEAIKINQNQKKINPIVIASKIPLEWVKKDDVKLLLKIIDSEEKCKCYLGVFSSAWPNQESNIGGYAIMLIESFKNNNELNLSNVGCPITNKEKVLEILNWWKNNYEKKE